MPILFGWDWERNISYSIREGSGVLGFVFVLKLQYSNFASCPQVGVEIKNIGNHHLVITPLIGVIAPVTHFFSAISRDV